MKTFNKKITLNTKKEFDCIDITDQVTSIVKKSDIKNGLINIQSMHTTASIIINENEPLLLEDVRDHLEKLASRESEYRHDNMEVRTVNVCDDECANGHSHCRAILLTTSSVINLLNGSMQLGKWQRILFRVELFRIN